MIELKKKEKDIIIEFQKYFRDTLNLDLSERETLSKILEMYKGDLDAIKAEVRSEEIRAENEILPEEIEAENSGGGIIADLSNHESPLIEILSKCLHDLWWEWSQKIAQEEALSSDRVERWEKLWIEYCKLPEDIKNQDRVFARRVYSAIAKYL